MTSNGWAEVTQIQELVERKPTRVTVEGEPVLLLRTGEEVLAIGNRCTHQGAPLDKGVVRIAGSVRTVTCPAHGSTFRLGDGKVVRPPATKPVPVYDVNIEDGRVLIRRRD